MPDFDLELERHHGLTHVIDKGLGPRAWEDVLETAGDHISIVKLGWGTAAVTQNLRRKLEVLQEKPVVIGGTFFEVVYAKGRLEEYKRWLGELGIDHVEISDGTIDIPRDRINVNGGAIAMGHPLGATGAMVFGTVLDELERRGLRTALVTLCIGAGMGTATVIERM